LLLLAGLVYALQYRPVQTYLAKKAASYLSSELSATVSVGGLYFKPFSSLTLNSLYVADQAGDTLLYAEKLTAALDLWQLGNGLITIKEVDLEGGAINVKQDSNRTNLSFLINYFHPGAAAPEASNRVALKLHAVNLSGVSFAYHRIGSYPRHRGIDFNNLRLTGISGRFSEIELDSQLFKSVISDLTFRERSGFRLLGMNASAVVNTHTLELQNLDLITNRSRLRNSLVLEYNSFSDFRNFIDSVTVSLSLRNSRIHSKDIGFFAPDIATNFDIDVSGYFTGTVSAFRGRGVTMQMGDSTTLRTHLSVVGLPDISHTVFDLQISRLLTTGREVELLTQQLSNSYGFALPPVVHRLGKITYQGKINGLYSDFAANGTLETALGIAHTDIDLNLRDGGHYSGQLVASDFDLGRLLGTPHIGNGMFDVVVAGEGLTLDSMNSKVTGVLGYLDVNGYRYKGISVAGALASMRFDGHVGIADPNLEMEFDGTVDLTPDAPEYAFAANIGHADLTALGLYRRMPLIIKAAAISSNFQGNTINNMQGKVALRDLHFQADTTLAMMDSLILEASGNETRRTLHLASDLADGTLTGEIDLSTLDNYFKSVAMRYAPSLELDIGSVGRQSFDVELNIKRFGPIAALLAPEVHLPEGALLRAQFSTLDHETSLNLLIPKLSHKGIKISRLIVDESNQGEALRLSLTTDRISMGDSLYIDNLNVSNLLANDSLHFNLKLSDAAATNRLDLNGGARFKKGATMTIHLLPSSLILGGEPWQLTQDASFFLDSNGVHINRLEISNNRQVAAVEGMLSSDTDTKASLTFRNFDLGTFNSLTMLSGIELSGVLDGKMDISSVFKNPYALADIAAKEVRFNQAYIGNVLLRADFDQVRKLVNLRLEASRSGVNTMTATGTYDAAAVENKLNVKAGLNQTELTILQPFLRKLVSNVSGTLSADLRITGTVLAPRISGTCYLHDAGFTVNYLKTPYRINDKVRLINSTFLLQDLTITDPRDNKAIANGKVDFSNPMVPEINVAVDATDFLVLNTTFRDNALYYGTAYGTGRFTFAGPTNAMNIDIQARTDENTRIHIPLNATGTVSDNDFIHFVNPDTLDAAKPQSRLFKGLSMNMDLQVTPQAETSLSTDLGELSGRGEGLLSLRVSSLGDFEMFGEYTINAGKFTFTAQDFINKIFDINKGGTIRWTGQPTEAAINLTAVYEQRTSLGPLYDAAGGRKTTEQRVLAQAEMNLSGNVMRPDITFALNFPNDPYVNDELQSYLSDANNVNQQALSLIIRRSFAPGAAADFSRELNNTLLNAGTELAFNQLNNLITQSLNLNFVDLNIRSLNDASASVRLFNDRLIFTGGVTDMRNLNDFNVFSNRVVTDAELLYLIRKDGRLILRGSNRLNSRNSLPLTINDNYVSALGLVYRQEFYTFREFFRRLVTIRRPEEEEGDK